VGVELLGLRLGVYKRPPQALDKVIGVVLVGEHLARCVLGKLGLVVTFRNFG
jgi:hypothetical protein